MPIDALRALSVQRLADNNAHLYLWTTHRFLRAAFDVMDTWGFRYTTTLTWSKRPKGIGGGTFISSSEFVLFGVRGSPPVQKKHMGTVFQWPRSNNHSQKPDHFYDLVEQLSPGPYVELFARRHRLGWDVWGDESAHTAELAV